MAQEEGSAGIGARLRAAREKKGLTILQSAEKLHMDARLLEALEAGDFASLGAPVYVRGHLRRYAELVGESPADLQVLYSGAPAASTPDLTRIPRAERNAESSRLLLPALIGVVALALAGVIWWLVSLPRTKAQAVATVSQPVSAEAAASGTVADPVPAAPEAGSASSEATAAPATAAASGGAPAPAAAPDGQVHIELRAAEDSWIKIWDGGGKALLDTTMRSGTARSVEGVPPLRLQVGNAHGVGLAVNGQPVNLDSMARKRGDARFWVDKAGQVALTAPPGPGE